MATFKAVFENMSVTRGPEYVDLGPEADSLATAFPAAQELAKRERDRCQKAGVKVLPVLKGLKYS